MSDFEPLEFDGLAFDALDEYKRELVEVADRVRQLRAGTAHIGHVLTRDDWELGRSTIDRISPRNESPTFPVPFLYFVKHPERVTVIDKVLVDAATLTTRGRHRQLLADLARDMESALPELAVFAAARQSGMPVRLFPSIPGNVRIPDLAVEIAGRDVFIEVTVLTQGRFWDGVDEAALAAPTRTWTGSGPGISKEANRISWKVEEELKQVAPGSPNVLMVVFNNVFPSKLARGIGFDNALSGPMFVPLPSGTLLDFSPRVHLDSVFELEGHSLKRIFVSPESFERSRLTDEERLLLNSTFQRLPFSFP